jgi:hypothetical protein
MCFKGLKPIKIIAGGHKNSLGADDSSSATIIFPFGKTATLITHNSVNLENEAIVFGTKGLLKVNKLHCKWTHFIKVLLIL